MNIFRRRRSDDTDDSYYDHRGKNTGIGHHHDGQPGTGAFKGGSNRNDGFDNTTGDNIRRSGHFNDNRMGDTFTGRNVHDNTTGTAGTTGTTALGQHGGMHTGIGGHDTGFGHNDGGISNRATLGHGREQNHHHRDGIHDRGRYARPGDDYDSADDEYRGGGRRRSNRRHDGLLRGGSRHSGDEYRNSTFEDSYNNEKRRSLHDGRLSRSSRRSQNRHSRSRSGRNRPLFDVNSGYYNRRPGFGTWIKGTVIDLLTMVTMGAVALGTFFAGPASHRNFPVIYPTGSIVYPQFAYPLRDEIIPLWSAALLSVLGPIVIMLLMQIRIRSFWDANNAVVGLLYSCITAAVFQVLIKWLIGGIAPNFLDACMPDTSKAGLNGNGYLGLFYARDSCTGSNHKINQTLESFPNGQATVAFAGWVYLFLYFNAKLKVFANHHSNMWKLVILYAPILGASLISLTPTVDNYANWYDILIGAIIGTLFAFSAFRMVYASVWDFRFNHIPLTRHTPFSYGAGAPGAAGFETAVFTHTAGWGYEEAFGGAPFDAGHHLRGMSGGVDNLMGSNLGSRHPSRHHSGRSGAGHRHDLERDAALAGAGYEAEKHAGHHHNHRQSPGAGLGHHRSDRTLTENNRTSHLGSTPGATTSNDYDMNRGNYDNPRSTNAGPHDTATANKMDPRVDSDRDGRNDPTSRVGVPGNTQDSRNSGFGGTTATTGYGAGTGTTAGLSSGNVGGYDNPRSTNVGPHSSNLENKLDPRVDSDRDGRGDPNSRVGGLGNTQNSGTSGFGSSIGTTGYGTNTGNAGQRNTSTGYDNPHSTNTGPHASNIENKLDPRVDSDNDGRNNPMSRQGGYGNTQTGGTSGFSGTTGLGSTSTTSGFGGGGISNLGAGDRGSGTTGNRSLHDSSTPGVHLGSGAGTGTGTKIGQVDPYNTSTATGAGSGFGTSSMSYDRSGGVTPTDQDGRYRSHRKSLERKAVPGERAAF